MRLTNRHVHAYPVRKVPSRRNPEEVRLTLYRKAYWRAKHAALMMIARGHEGAARQAG